MAAEATLSPLSPLLFGEGPGVRLNIIQSGRGVIIIQMSQRLISYRVAGVNYHTEEPRVKTV